LWVRHEQVELTLRRLDIPGCFLASVSGELRFDPAVEGIIDRIVGLSRRLRRMIEATLQDYGLSFGEYKVLALLWNARPERLSAGRLAESAELSTGAMTNRLDRLEAAKLVRRVRDPGDRRGVLVELTEKGHGVYAEAAQARKEALLAAALTDAEKDRLNGLLRRLMLEFEREEAEQKDH
jgi:DNA-binding MarR family transcriptional regulator